MDKTAGDQESAALKSFGDALRASIMRNRYVPNEADWATAVATELGVDTAAVTTNPRRQPRLFLIDPNLSIAGGGLPYTQTSTGSVSQAVSPRVMIVSSVGRQLPAAFNSGVPASANFNAIWDWNDAGGALPATGFAWPGWPNGDDLKVQRVDLSSLFVRLRLSWTASSHQWPRYSIDSSAWATAIAVTNLNSDWPGYFLQSSILYLHNYDGTLDSQQILIRDNSFIYDQDVWRGSIGGQFFLGGVDIASAVDRYLAAYPNRQARNGTNQQATVVQSMINFMDRYDDWANAGFPTNPAPSYVVVSNAQINMMSAVQGQYLKNSYNPTQVNCQ